MAEPTNPTSDVPSITVIDVPHAPFIYFETTPALGHVNGLIKITLCAQAIVMNNNVPVGQDVVVAYLRSNVPGMLSLRDAIDKAILLAAPPVEGSEGKAN